MSEPPDLEQIAREIGHILQGEYGTHEMADAVALLRQVYARGAAQPTPEEASYFTYVRGMEARALRAEAEVLRLRALLPPSRS